MWSLACSSIGVRFFPLGVCPALTCRVAALIEQAKCREIIEVDVIVGLCCSMGRDGNMGRILWFGVSPHGDVMYYWTGECCFGVV